jgi:hypothetical protein
MRRAGGSVVRGDDVHPAFPAVPVPGEVAVLGEVEQDATGLVHEFSDAGGACRGGERQVWRPAVGEEAWVGGACVIAGVDRVPQVEEVQRPHGVVVPEVLGPRLTLGLRGDDEQLVGDVAAQLPYGLLPADVRSGCRRRTDKNPDAIGLGYGSEESVNWPAGSLIRNLADAARWPRAARKRARVNAS